MLQSLLQPLPYQISILVSQPKRVMAELPPVNDLVPDWIGCNVQRIYISQPLCRERWKWKWRWILLCKMNQFEFLSSLSLNNDERADVSRNCTPARRSRGSTYIILLTSTSNASLSIKFSFFFHFTLPCTPFPPTSRGTTSPSPPRRFPFDDSFKLEHFFKWFSLGSSFTSFPYRNSHYRLRLES